MRPRASSTGATNSTGATCGPGLVSTGVAQGPRLVGSIAAWDRGLSQPATLESAGGRVVHVDGESRGEAARRLHVKLGSHGRIAAVDDRQVPTVARAKGGDAVGKPTEV